MLSIVIPTLNEAAALERLLPHLAHTCPEAEAIVVDGGGTDGTQELVRRFPGVRLIEASRGRARQMNAGAGAAGGSTILFLHADTVLPPDAPHAIEDALRVPGVVGGRFDVRFDNPRAIFTLIATMMNRRSRLTRICTGDQAIFVRRQIFEALGGYPDIPLMEDIELSRRLKRRGRIACLRQRVTTSARKWEREGVLRTIALMWALRLLYWAGVEPARLHGWYYGGRADGSPGISGSAGAGGSRETAELR
jgi:rSAM/selenodomain-associated transferase 2